MAIKLIHGIKAGAKLYFIGIGGISMSGLAAIAFANGYEVRGSDAAKSEHTEYLRKMGIEINNAHKPENIDEFSPDFIIFTAAISKSNPEFTRAKALSIPCIDRAEFLGWMSENFRKVINIAGTHGKTTTTAMTSLLLMSSGADPTVHLGAQLIDFDNATVHLGNNNDVFVSEACEYNNSFLHSGSSTAVILNIDNDHLDFFGNMEHLIQSFTKFATNLHGDRQLILPAMDKHISELIDILEKNCESSGENRPKLNFFGFEGDFSDISKSDFCKDAKFFIAKNIEFVGGYPHYDMELPGEETIKIELGVPGAHNIKNSLAAVAAAHYNGLKHNVIGKVLKNFKGAAGRFALPGKAMGALVVLDYAHHPKEARATIDAAKNFPHKKLLAVFQPINYTRVKLLGDEFLSMFAEEELDHVVFYDVYSSREKPTDGADSYELFRRFSAKGHSCSHARSYEDAADSLRQHIEPGDMVIFMGPERLHEEGRRFVEENP